MAGTMKEALAKAMTPEQHCLCHLNTAQRAALAAELVGGPILLTKQKGRNMDTAKQAPAFREPSEIDDQITMLKRQIRDLENEKSNARPEVRRVGDFIEIRGLTPEPLTVTCFRFYYFVKKGGLTAMRDAAPGGKEAGAQ